MNISHKWLIPITTCLCIGLFGCQSTPQATKDQIKAPPVPQVSSADPKNAQPLYKDMTEFGEMMGCKSALAQQGTPDSDFVNVPKLTGTKEDYLNGWKKGFNKCLMGLGPVQLPVQK